MTDDVLPAWSDPFTGAGRERLRRVPPLPTITREWAWGGATGAGIMVAIIDSGLEVDHPALRGRVVDSVESVIEDGEVRFSPADGRDVFGHGTACGAIVVDLAPEVDLVSVRVLGPELRGKGVAFAAGLDWAMERGARVMNLSLSTHNQDLYGLFHELADEAYFRNVALVGAANNSPGLSYPSLFSSVFSVAAHDEPDPMRIYYNPAPPVEFGAWGVNVPVAWKDGGWTTATGNSFAAPHIAGLVARILSKHPDLTPFEVKAVLAAVADNERPDGPDRRSRRSRRTAAATPPRPPSD